MSLHEDAHKCLSLPHERYRFVIYSYKTSKKLRQGISKPSGERIRITFKHRYYRNGLKLFRINTIRIQRRDQEINKHRSNQSSQV